jgi:NAD(P)-dependent dehydrogenase (short-subunit alcohol dehydrogenase family)
MEPNALKGKVAVVTGASRGVGRAVALELSSLGADVVVTARTVAPRADIAGTIGETVAAITEAGGSAVALAADLLVQDDLDRLVKETVDKFGRVDILVNNAAYIGDSVFESVWEMSPDSWRTMIELNVNIPWALSKAFAPTMRDQGSGLIVNMSSGASHIPDGSPAPLPGAGGLGAAYPTSKTALNQMTAQIGNELRAVGITMVAIDPGFAKSESAVILSGRLGISADYAQPVEIAAKAISYIATLDDPSPFACRYYSAKDITDEHGLMG